MQRIAADSVVLVPVSELVYATWCMEFPDTSVVCVVAGEVAGFALGAPFSTSSNRLFVWQVAVDHRHRDRGLGLSMLSYLMEEAALKDISILEATTVADGGAAVALFASVARRRGARLTTRRVAGDCGNEVPHWPQRIEIHW